MSSRIKRPYEQASRTQSPHSNKPPATNADYLETLLIEIIKHDRLSCVFPAKKIPLYQRRDVSDEDVGVKSSRD